MRTREGKNGFGMLFISRDMGVQTKAIKTTYSSCAGTWATTESGPTREVGHQHGWHHHSGELSHCLSKLGSKFSAKELGKIMEVAGVNNDGKIN